VTPLSYFIVLSAVLFAIGISGLCFRRNMIVVFMCIELMLNATNLCFVAFARGWGNLDGQVAAFFVMVVAAAEAAVGMAIIISMFRSFRSVETSIAGTLKS
jgi:NADH-quinone oxidoreductase subunit K